MVSLNKLKQQKGFTIVELLIVIVVIGILATLVIVTFTGIQRRARDSQRQTDVNAVASQISAYFADKGYYPTLGNLNDSTWVSANLKGLDPEALKDPKFSGTGSPVVAYASADSSHYGYKVTTDTDGDCSSDVTSCTKYSMVAKLESGSDFTKSGN